MDLSKCRCVNCSEYIEFESSQAGAIIPCPHCNLETQLFIPATRSSLGKTSHKKESITKESVLGGPGADASVRNYLMFIRSHSAYMVLRFVINICCVVSIIGAVVYLLSLCINIDNFLFTMEMCFLSFIAILVLMAARQSALLLIDIADTLLLEHSKSGTRNL